MSDKQPIHPLLVGTTPGPWRISRANPCVINTDQGGDSISIADAMGYDNPLYASIEQAPFNAKLIAQAPSLAAENAALAEQVERLMEALDFFYNASLRADKQWRGLNMANPGEKMAYEIMQEARIKAGTLLSKYK